VAPRSLEEQTLAHIWAEVLGLERVGVFDNFFALGGDSILSIQITAQANQAGIQLATRQIFQYQTIAELVAAGIQRQTVQVSQEMVVGEVPLTPIQHWFFEQNFTDPHHWNQAVLLESKQALDPVLLEQVVRQLLTHHDALRLRFYHDAQDWRQVNVSVSEATPFICVDLSRVPPTDRSHVLETTAVEAQASLNLSDGPLVRVVLFHLPDQPDRLLIIIHHLAVDGISWRILLEDMLTLYQQLARGEAFWLAPKTTSFQEWATRLGDYAQSAALQSELDYWLPVLKKEFYPLPLDKTGGANTTRSARGVAVRLDRHETQTLLHQVPTVYQTQINDALLTALLYAFTQWTGKPALLCELEGHGREEIFESVDLTRTVGWFTSLFPVWLELENTWFELGKALKSVKEQLRQLPRQGMGYGLLRYLSGDQAIINRLQAAPRAQVSFNYLGQFDQVFQETALFRLLQENSGPTRSLRGKRTHLIEINSLVSNGELAVFFNYSENLHNKRTIERLSQDFLEALREIIAHCLSPDAGGYTPSDFPEAGLSQAALEHIMAQVGDIGE
jgi:non-ribosomal peptide synthase protein (TIGR01720 family)